MRPQLRPSPVHMELKTLWGENNIFSIWAHSMGSGPQRRHALQLGLFPHKEKKMGRTYNDFDDRNNINQRIKISKSIPPIKVMRNQVYLKAAADDYD